MSRHAFLVSLLTVVGFVPAFLRGQDADPAVSITSPDDAKTFVYSTIKEHSLVWDEKDRLLVAHIVFSEINEENQTTDDDVHDFRLPGVTFDPAKGLFFATSVHGEIIPVARIKKELFFKTVESLPNAVVRILHLRGNVSVILEALRPDDPALHPPAPSSASDQGQTVDIRKSIN